jgi:hypothetical protein
MASREVAAGSGTGVPMIVNRADVIPFGANQDIVELSAIPAGNG